MGVPDFIKFVANAAPQALATLPKGTGNRASFDHLLVDANNAHYTGTESHLKHLLERCNITKSVHIVFDAARQRTGIREQRGHASQHKMDVVFNDLAAKVSAAQKIDVFINGRDIPGEGDFKLFYTYQRLMHQDNDAKILVVSEDSDIVCGVLCGLYPQNASIATRLHDVTSDLCLLRMDHVVAFLYKQFVKVHQIVNRPRDRYAPTPPAPPPKPELLHSLRMDFVFLFTMIMGNQSVPSIAKGTTKVDTGNTWQQYLRCRAKNGLSSSAIVGADAVSGDFTISFEALNTVLASMNFADAIARPPAAEERKAARNYLRQIGRTLFRLAMGVPMDTRMEAKKEVPSMANLLHVLAVGTTRSYEFALGVLPSAMTTSKIKIIRGGRSVGFSDYPAKALVDEKTSYSVLNAHNMASVRLPSGTMTPQKSEPSAKATGAFSFEMRKILPMQSSETADATEAATTAKSKVLLCAGLGFDYRNQQPQHAAPPAAAAIATQPPPTGEETSEVAAPKAAATADPEKKKRRKEAKVKAKNKARKDAKVKAEKERLAKLALKEARRAQHAQK